MPDTALARLILAGRLRATGPEPVAEQLLALLVGHLKARSRMGPRLLGDDELREVARVAVDTFLQAYAPSGRQTIES
ncbi:TetR/AcrR family transcriptional regulator C-terminal domain-containing protein [Streptosporangium sp. NBC_01639]|uniref:TetR/AcrR family transcriptional regulator C-terminal domain-containing protein n=1 Tax=Streptosporangium sp. NBC_01639 TaxID=2975948 RepID=UPI003863D717|nr:TetR/AcrR family transcriptional regulator C-terminal domain-containing protein [Streptosporangium sp. NBC_01639]